MPKFWGSIKNWSSIFFSGQILTMHFPKPKMTNVTQKSIDSKSEFKHFERLWSKIQHFREATISIIFHIITKKCCNLGFVICQYFCGLFPTLMINILKRFVFASKFKHCHWSFSGNITLKRVAVIAWFPFFFDMNSRVSWYDDCEKTEKTCYLTFAFEESKYQRWFVFFLTKANFH